MKREGSVYHGEGKPDDVINGDALGDIAHDELNETVINRLLLARKRDDFEEGKAFNRFWAAVEYKMEVRRRHVRVWSAVAFIVVLLSFIELAKLVDNDRSMSSEFDISGVNQKVDTCMSQEQVVDVTSDSIDLDLGIAFHS